MKILYHHLGLIKYSSCLALQEEFHAVIKEQRDKKIAVIFTLEHENVITLGKNASPEHLFVTEDFLVNDGIDLLKTERGGEVTAHMPGQLVMYPIIPLSRFNISPRLYVTILLDTVISVLQNFGISAGIDKNFPGVWVNLHKICAVGIRIKERTSMHGIALNIRNDFKLFEMILPCGISGRGITSMERLIDSCPSLLDISNHLVESLSLAIGAEVIKIHDLQTLRNLL